jgi:hypothetical protein
MTRKKLVIPSFKKEKEEAAWWDRQRAAVEAELRAAMREDKTLSLHDVMNEARKNKEPTVDGRNAEQLWRALKTNRPQQL